jgi:hypothetical protein
MFNDPEWASKEEWDAYVWFGIAISEGQMIEMRHQVIATALAMHAGAPDNHKNHWFRLYDDLGGLMLGRLLEKVKRHEVLSQEVVELLNNVKDRRNALAHLFFRPRTDDSSARTVMIATQERQEAASLFRHVSTRLDSVMHEILDKFHMSRAQWRNNWDNFAVRILDGSTD